MDIREETKIINNEIKRLGNFIKGVELDDFVNPYKIMETQDVIRLLIEHLIDLSCELESRYQ